MNNSEYAIAALVIIWLISLCIVLLTADKAVGCPERINWILAFMVGFIVFFVTTGFGLILVLCYTVLWIWEHVRVEVTW